MGNRLAKTHPTPKPPTKEEYMLNAINDIEKGLDIGQPACNYITSIETGLNRIMPIKPNPR